MVFMMKMKKVSDYIDIMYDKNYDDNIFGVMNNTFDMFSENNNYNGIHYENV